MPAARELCNASGPEEKKTLERQIKDKDEANTGENTAESYRWSTAELPHCWAHRNKTRASRIRDGDVPQAGQSKHSPWKFKNP